MTLKALPIALRELRVAARRPAIYRVRYWAALVAVGLTGWIFVVSLISSSPTPPAALGTEIFQLLASVLLGFVLLAGSRATADCLSEEKRDGTLGLLFLTDLKGYDVVAGKMAANSMNCVYGLLAAFPVLTLPLLLGGVSWGLVWRMILMLLNTLFLSLSAGIFASSICRKERTACGVAFLLVAVITGGLPAIGAAYREYILKASDLSIPALFLYPSPLIQYVTALNGLSGGFFGPGVVFNAFDFWASFGTIHALGWLFLLIACRAAPKSWQDTPDSLWLERWRRFWQHWCYGDSADRAELRDRMLDVNPFLWICGGRDRLQRALLWGLLGLLAVGFLYGAFKWPQDWFTAPTAVGTVLVFGSTLKYWLAGESTRRCIDIKRDGGLELLVCTPLTVNEMLRGQYLAMKRIFGGPLLAIAVMDFLMLAIALNDTHDQEDRSCLVLSFLAAITLLVADFYTLIWVGSWQGLTAKNAKIASGATAWRVLVLPWVIWGLSMPMWLFVARLGQSIGSSLSPALIIGWWLAIGLFVDWFYGVSAYRKLHANLRTIAAQRYHLQPKRRWWQFFTHEKENSLAVADR